MSTSEHGRRPSRWVRLTIWGAVACGACALLTPVACVAAYVLQQARAGPPLPTLDGPEHSELARRLSGWLVVNASDDELDVIDFPSLDHTTIHTSGDRTWLLAGPDRKRRIVSVTDAPSGHQLRVTDVRGEPDEQLFERAGDPCWNSVIGELKLSAQGRAAYWARAFDAEHPFQPQTPARVELLDLDTRTRSTLELDAEHTGWEWHPDGKRLIVTHFARSAPDGAQVAPAYVTLFDVDSNLESAQIGFGGVAFIEPDGKRMWIGSYSQSTWSVVDPDAQTTEQRTVVWSSAIASPARDMVLAYANPTTGVEQRYLRTLQKSPQAMWTIKLFDARSGAFVTIVDWVARFHHASWGAR